MKDTITILEEEHKHILKALKDVENISNQNSINEKDLNTLKKAVNLFIEANKHHEREEKVLFPAVEAKGFTCAPEQMRIEHIEIKELKKQLKNAVEAEDIQKIKEIASKLVPMLTEHIWKEDNILYPTARELLKKGGVGKMKKEFDKIGYCCFHPIKSEKRI